mgnify:CR=1 FL=1
MGPNQFQDRTGATWTVVVDIGGIKRVRTATGLPFAVVDEHELDTAAKIMADPAMLADALFGLVDREELAIRKLDREAFAARFTGEELEASHGVLWRAYADFFRPRKELLLAVMAAGDHAWKARQAALMDRLTQARSTSSSSPSESPGSSASIPQA